MRPGPARTFAWIAAVAALITTLAYLRDPPWLGRVTSGLSTWREDESGVRYRWTTRGRASLYVSADAARVTLPLRSGVARPDGAPVEASIGIDGRVFSTVVLDDPLHWVPVTFSIPHARSSRRAVRIEILVKRLLRRDNLGIQVGEPVLRSPF